MTCFTVIVKIHFFDKNSTARFRKRERIAGVKNDDSAEKIQSAALLQFSSLKQKP